MTNTFVNRIRQRIEARRDFMRTVFSNHHALVWRMTDAPSLRLLGIKPKRLEPNRSRAVAAAKEAIRQPRAARATEIPELEIETIAHASVVEETQAPIERNADMLNLEQPVELEPSDQSLNESALSELPLKLEPQRARETLERPETSATPERQPGAAPSVRSGETTPPDVSPRASEPGAAKRTEEPERLQVQPLEHNQIADQEAVASLDARGLEQALPVVAEVTEIRHQDTVQNTNSSTIEQPQNMIEPESTPETTQNQNVPTTPAKSITAARAQEVLQKAAELDSQKLTSNTRQTPTTESRSQDQVQKPDSSEPTLEATSRLESDLESISENRVQSEIEPQLEPELVTRDAPEVPRDSVEHQVNNDVQTSSLETESSISTTEIEAQKQLAKETRASETKALIDSAQEENQVASISESSPPETREAVQTLQESVPRESHQESAPRESQQEFAARDVQQESMPPEARQEFTARDVQQEFTAREARQESVSREVQPESQDIPETKLSPEPTPEQSDWQRSIPGDPQSGVVEIIRARPPRNLRPESHQKPSEARETKAKQEIETPDARVTQIPSESRVTQSPENQTKQTLAERMKSLQNRYGDKEQTRFDPSTNSFAQSIEAEAGDANAPAPKFQSISDVAQRLARRYSDASPASQNEAPELSSDPKVGQTFNTTQTRAASAFVQQGTQPVQLRESTVVFLEPLIGFDPREAKVFVSPQATEFTSSLNADGATVGADVYLNNGFDEQTPTGLGLLAHELTHVGQNLQTNFVPPMLQSTSKHDLTNESGETQARMVEARVTNTASVFVPGISLEAAGAPRTNGTSASTNTAQTTDSWNGLPAPWEAMPSFHSKTTSNSTLAPNVSDSSATSGTGFVSGVEAPSAAVQLAESDRPADNPDNVQPGAAGGQPQPPAQDMDLLAQQVYDILKRRLSSERRREG